MPPRPTPRRSSSSSATRRTSSGRPVDLQQPDRAEAHLGVQGQRGHPQGHQRERRRDRPLQVQDRTPRTGWSGSETTPGGPRRPRPRGQAQVHRRHRQRRQQRRPRPADAGRLRPLATTSCPGVATLVDKGYVSTYYKTAPYMLSANTAWLVTNDKKAPLDDPRVPQGHRAGDQRPGHRQQGLRQHRQGRRPDGPPPDLGEVHRHRAARRASASRTTRPRPRTILDAAGYKKGGDGFYTNKDGSPIKLTIMVPSGWSDWEAARDVIVAQPEGRRHQRRGQDHRLQRPRRRPQQRQLRPGPQQRGPGVATRRGPTTTTSSASRS